MFALQGCFARSDSLFSSEVNCCAVLLKRLQRSGGKLIIFKPSEERVTTCKDYVISKEITTILMIAVNHANCDVYSPNSVE